METQLQYFIPARKFRKKIKLKTIFGD